MLSDMVIFLAAAYAAAVFATVAGFGSSTLLVPVAVLFMDIKTAVFLVACFHLFNNLFKVRLFFKNIDYQIFWTFGTASIVFAFLGARCITLFPGEMLKVILAVFLISFCFLSILHKSFTFKNSPATSVFGGGLSGFMAGLIGLGGAVRSAFLISFKLPKEVYIATSALIAFVVDIIRIPTYILGGAVTEHEYYRLLPFLVVVAYLGVRTGKTLVGKIDQEKFQNIVYTGLILVAIIFLVEQYV